MSARVRVIAGVVVMAAVLLLYVLLVGVRAVALIITGEPVALAMGIGLIVLPLLGLWGLGRELRFGYTATKLGDELETLGELPQELISQTASGRPIRDEADAAFPSYREAAEREPTNWMVWMRLGIVYDAAGDRKRARQAIRQAIALKRNDIRAKQQLN